MYSSDTHDVHAATRQPQGQKSGNTITQHDAHCLAMTTTQTWMCNKLISKYTHEKQNVHFTQKITSDWYDQNAHDDRWRSGLAGFRWRVHVAQLNALGNPFMTSTILRAAIFDLNLHVLRMPTPKRKQRIKQVHEAGCCWRQHAQLLDGVLWSSIGFSFSWMSTEICD